MKNSTITFAGYFTSLAIVLVLMVSGCGNKDRDDAEPTPTVDLTNEESVFATENLMADANRDAEVILKDTLFYKDECGIIDTVIAHGQDDTTYKVRFDTCTNTFGRVKNGVLYIRITGKKLYMFGVKIKIVFENFTINNYKIEGERRMEKTSTTIFSVTDSCKITDLNSGKYIRWKTSRVHEWTSGVGATTANDFVFVMNSEGDYYHYRGDGEKQLHVVITELTRKGDCRWPVSGTVKVTPIGSGVYPTREVDFGYNGTDCNSLVGIYINGQYYTYKNLD